MTAWLICQHGNGLILGSINAELEIEHPGWATLHTPAGEKVTFYVDDGYRKLWVRRRHVPLVMKLEGFKP